jgi:hypothetical protein
MGNAPAWPHGICTPKNMFASIKNKQNTENSHFIIIYDNYFTLIIDIYFYETLSTPTQSKALVLHSLDTLPDIRIKAFTLLF